MTVRELIAKLQELPDQDAKIAVHAGFIDSKVCVEDSREVVKINLTGSKWAKSGRWLYTVVIGNEKEQVSDTCYVIVS